MFEQQALVFKSPLRTALPLLHRLFIDPKTRKETPFQCFQIIDSVDSVAELTFSRPDYTLGHSVSLGSLILCIITVLLQILYCRWENKQRENGSRDHRLHEGSEHWLGHRHPAFRYTI